jgi:hypothetical protein
VVTEEDRMHHEPRTPPIGPVDDPDRRLRAAAAELADWIEAGPAADARRTRDLLAARPSRTPTEEREVAAVRAQLLGLLRRTGDLVVLLRDLPAGAPGVETLERLASEVDEACRAVEEAVAHASCRTAFRAA